MRKLKDYALLIVYIVLLVVITGAMDKYEVENKRLKGDVTALLNENEQYKVNDSLNAIKTDALKLTIGNLKEHRTEDLALIKEMQGKNEKLQSLAKAKTTIRTELQTLVTESIYVDRWHVDTLRCIEASDPWTTLSGCIDKQGNFNGTIETHDTLLISAFVEYKRFLGFLWRTNKVKSRKVDAVSRNPHVKINDLEYIEVYY